MSEISEMKYVDFIAMCRIKKASLQALKKYIGIFNEEQKTIEKIRKDPSYKNYIPTRTFFYLVDATFKICELFDDIDIYEECLIRHIENADGVSREIAMEEKVEEKKKEERVKITWDEFVSSLNEDEMKELEEKMKDMSEAQKRAYRAVRLRWAGRKKVEHKE